MKEIEILQLVAICCRRRLSDTIANETSQEPQLTHLRQEILDQTEALLQKWKHPDPYRPPTAPGGSKYERNLQAPILDREWLQLL